MTNIRLEIHPGNCQPNEKEEKGFVEKDAAIEEFQNFPWDAQIRDFLRALNKYNAPTFVFSSDSNKELFINATDAKGFNVEYFNYADKKYADFYISNEIEKNNWTIEEIIAFFFDESIENYLDLEELETTEEIKPAKSIIEFQFAPNYLKSFGIWPYIGIVLSSVILWKTLTSGITLLWITQIYFGLMWIPACILHLTYYFKNKDASVLIDNKNHELTYRKGTYEIKLSKKDIFRTQLTVAKARSFNSNYSYLWFILHDGRYVVITCFIDDPEKIANTFRVQYETADKLIPFLPV